MDTILPIRMTLLHILCDKCHNSVTIISPNFHESIKVLCHIKVPHPAVPCFVDVEKIQ